MPDLQRLVQGALDSLGSPGHPMTPRQAAKLTGGKASYETIRKIVRGEHSGDIKDHVVEGLVALGLNRADILRATNQSHLAELPRWNPPAAAHRMTLRQRRAVENLISVLTDEEVSESTELRTAAEGYQIVPVETDLPGVSVTGLVGHVAGMQEEIRQVIARNVAEMQRQAEQDRERTAR